MGPVVEGHSLATLTNLASNPPLYPRNPTEPAQPPLTLYIVRVPGSRDVFLSPLKPREKVVNAQDVQSSLYFLHINSPEDGLFSDPDEPVSMKNSSLSPSTSIIHGARVARKPLPTPPSSPDTLSPSTFMELRTSPKQTNGMPKRKPVVPSRSPLRARSPTEHHILTDDARQNSNGLIDLPNLPPRRRPSITRRSTDRSSRQSCEVQFEDNASYFTSLGGASAHQTAKLERAKEKATVSLTLIRRDPSTGAQWNVAKIRDPPVLDISSESAASFGSFRAKNSGAPLYLEVNNPGYSRFINFDHARPVSRSSLDTSSTESDTEASMLDGVFKRRLWMDGSRFADHTYSTRKSLSSAASSALPSKAAVDRRSNGYAFQSPWGGKCAFVTGIGGRSMKCKHFLQSPSAHHSAMSDVSELRFNLPANGGVSNQSGHDAAGSVNDGRRLPQVAGTPMHRYTQSDPTWDRDPDWTSIRDEHGNIDYSLGRERAGGGFGGKQAKLGKLIVDDEGQKMLDLVVAANMALWYRAYAADERT